MTTQSYSHQSEYGGHSVVATKPITAVLGMLALAGLLGAITVVALKLMKRYPVSNEKCPLLEDRSVYTLNYNHASNFYACIHGIFYSTE